MLLLGIIRYEKGFGGVVVLKICDAISDELRKSGIFWCGVLDKRVDNFVASLNCCWEKPHVDGVIGNGNWFCINCLRLIFGKMTLFIKFWTTKTLKTIRLGITLPYFLLQPILAIQRSSYACRKSKGFHRRITLGLDKLLHVPIKSVSPRWKSSLATKTLETGRRFWHFYDQLQTVRGLPTHISKHESRHRFSLPIFTTSWRGEGGSQVFHARSTISGLENESKTSSRWREIRRLSEPRLKLSTMNRFGKAARRGRGDVLKQTLRPTPTPKPSLVALIKVRGWWRGIVFHQY